MNILQILPELNVGGVERGTLDLAKYLVRHGHKAVVVSNGGALVGELERLGGIHYQLAVHKKSPLNIFRMVPRLIAIIKKEEIDIVHARSRIPAWIAYFACRSTRRVFITTCHGYYRKHPVSLVMGWAKRVIAISNVVARHMIEDFGVPRERIRLIPRSVDLEKFKYIPPDKKKGRDFQVGIIGRLTPIKGHLYFIRAMARVARMSPNLKIWIVGDAPASKDAYKEQVRVLVKRLGLWHCTEFLGTQKNIPDILAHLDLLVLATTTQEAFGRVIIEAQAAGVPVVATRVGGVVDIIEEAKTGLLVPPADPAAMAEAVTRIMKDPLFAKSLAENAYANVKEKYNLDKYTPVYDKAVRTADLDFWLTEDYKLKNGTLTFISTAALKALRERFSAGHKISCLVAEPAKEVLLRSPYIDELLVCDFKNKDKGLGGFWKLAGLLRKKNFDLVVDLQNNRKSHLLSALTLALERYGYDNKKFGFLLNHRIKNDLRGLSPLAHQFRILKMLGIELGEQRLELWPTPEDEDQVAEFLNSQWLSAGQKLVGINISASKRWTTKVWPLKHVIGLCEALSLKDIRVVLTGTAEDTGLAKLLEKRLPKAKLINSCGKLSINQLACLIKRCGVYISADSAPLHVASSVEAPIIALFGPTDPSRHLPPAKNIVVLRKELPCSFCYKPRCRQMRCMELISVEEVLAAVERLLSE